MQATMKERLSALKAENTLLESALRLACEHMATTQTCPYYDAYCKRGCKSKDCIEYLVKHFRVNGQMRSHFCSNPTHNARGGA